MSSGALSATSTFYIQGGTFQQSGGSMTVSSTYFTLGGAGAGFLVVTGGTFTHAGEILFGDLGGGEGTLNVSGSGTLNLNNLRMGFQGSGFINLDGGTLTANHLYSNTEFAAIWFNGGVLRANTSPSNPWIDPGIPILAVKSGGAIFDTNSKSVTFPGPLVAAYNSSGGLTKQGTGTLTLTASNSYLGATTISAGTLALSGLAAVSTSGTIDVRSAATLDVTALTGGLTVGGTQTLMGSGTVAGNVTVSGTHRPGNGVGKGTFKSGTLTFRPSSHLGWELVTSSTSTPGTNYDQVVAGAVSFVPGALLDISLTGSGSTVDFTNTFWTTSHVWTVVSSTATTGTPNIGGVSLDTTGHSVTSYGGFSVQNTTAGITLTWTPGVPTNTVSVVAATGSIAENSGPTAAFIVTRTGSTTASQVVYYSMSGSAVSGFDYVAIGSGTIPAGATSGTIVLTPIDNNLLDGTRTVTLTITYGGNYLIGTPSSASLSLTDNERLYSWTNPTTSGTLSWSGAGNWTGGSSALSDPVTNIAFFTGATLASGTITTNNDIANPLLLNVLTLGGTGAAGAVSNVTLTGGTLQLVANAGSPPVVNLDGMSGASGTLAYKVTNPVILTATTNVQGDGNATFTFSGPISGSGWIVKSGSSTLTLSGTNNFSGGVLINEGTVAMSSTASLPAGSNITVTTGGQLSILSTGTFSMGALTLSGSGAANNRGALYFNVTGSNTIPGAISLASGTTVRIGSFGIAGNMFLNGPISGNAPLTLWCGGGGITQLQTWILSGSSTYTGDTLVDASYGANGILRLSGGDNRSARRGGGEALQPLGGEMSMGADRPRILSPNKNQIHQSP